MRIQMRAPQDRALLPSLFAAIDEALAQAGIAHALAHDVRLVSEEVVCNAIEHGQPPGGEHEVTVEIAINDDRVTLCFRGMRYLTSAIFRNHGDGPAQKVPQIVR